MDRAKLASQPVAGLCARRRSGRNPTKVGFAAPVAGISAAIAKEDHA
jgi:hypothetical protein